MALLLSLFININLCFPIHGQEDPAWVDAICKISTGSSGGSGVLFQETNGIGWIATNYHVVTTRPSASATWDNGYKTSGKIIWKDRNADLAVLECPIPVGSVVLPIAPKEEMPRSGDIVQLAGYGLRGTTRKRVLTLWNAPVNGYLQKPNDADQIDVNTNAISGDSGGAIIYQGKLVAILWGGPTNGFRGQMTSVRGCVGNYLTRTL